MFKWLEFPLKNSTEPALLLKFILKSEKETWFSTKVASAVACVMLFLLNAAANPTHRQLICNPTDKHASNRRRLSSTLRWWQKHLTTHRIEQTDSFCLLYQQFTCSIRHRTWHQPNILIPNSNNLPFSPPNTYITRHPHEPNVLH